MSSIIGEVRHVVYIIFVLVLEILYGRYIVG